MENRDEILAKVLVGEATPEEMQLAEAWISDSEENRRYFLELKKIWAATPRSQVSVDEAWNRFQSRVKPAPMKLYRRWFWVAASLILVGGIAFWFLNQKEEIYTLETGTEVKTETLSDGSVITLNKLSSISYNHNFGKKRAVNLKGEAFFEVAPDPNKPFVIQANEVVVTVLGTSFNVKTDEQKTEVVVETGKVRVQWKEEYVLLEKGETAVFTTGTLQKTKARNEFHQYFRTGTLVCRETTIEELVEKLKEIYGREIRIENSSVAKRRINTVFKDQSLENILEIISKTLSIRVEDRDEYFVIK